jgi:hypothetical protein
VRGDAEAKASVHAPVAFGALALLGETQLLHLLRGALAEHPRREREDGQTAFVPGFSLALLVLACVSVVADHSISTLHEEGKLPQVLVYEVRVRPQLVEAPSADPDLQAHRGSHRVPLQSLHPERSL